MGQAKLHALGRNLKFFVTPETTLGEYVAINASDYQGMRVLSSSMEYAQERVDRADARGASRSLTDRITRRVNCTYSVESYLLPSGSAGTAPDTGPLFKAVMGTETTATSPATVTINTTTAAGVKYTLSATQAMGSLCLTRETSEVVSQRMRGCYVGEMTISGSGSDEPKVSFSGTGIEMINTGRSLAVGPHGATPTILNVTPGTGGNFVADSLITIGGTGGTATNVRVTSVSTDALTIPSKSWSDAVQVIPYTPALGDSGTPINGVSGSVTIGGLPASYGSMPITAFDVTVNNNTKALNDEAFTNLMTDFIPGFRSVTGNITVRANQEQILELNKRKLFGVREVEMKLGDITDAGSYAIIYMKACEFGFGALEIPEAEEATFTLSFTALTHSAAVENEIELGFF